MQVEARVASTEKNNNVRRSNDYKALGYRVLSIQGRCASFKVVKDNLVRARDATPGSGVSAEG